MSDEPKLELTNGLDPDDSHLRLFHQSMMGRIVISDDTGCRIFFMTKGDAIPLRDALNNWIESKLR